MDGMLNSGHAPIFVGQRQSRFCSYFLFLSIKIVTYPEIAKHSASEKLVWKIVIDTLIVLNKEFLNNKISITS